MITDIMLRVLAVTIGYALGCFQTAYIIGKCKNIDLREKGSGNLGTTNAFRVLGTKLGILTFVLDILKAVIAYWIAYHLIGIGVIGGLYAGVGVVLGHNYTFYLKFKGGKGIAATTGVMLCVNPLVTLIILFSALGLVYVTRYVSLGSICAMVALAIWGIINFNNNIEALILTVLLASMAILMHSSNIKRLLTGTENKFGTKKKEV